MAVFWVKKILTKSNSVKVVRYFADHGGLSKDKRKTVFDAAAESDSIKIVEYLMEKDVKGVPENSK